MDRISTGSKLDDDRESDISSISKIPFRKILEQLGWNNFGIQQWPYLDHYSYSTSQSRCKEAYDSILENCFKIDRKFWNYGAVFILNIVYNL